MTALYVKIVDGKRHGPKRGPAKTVDMWYDVHTKLWVVQCKDIHGNQIGAAAYGPRKTAECEKREREQAIADGTWTDESW